MAEAPSCYRRVNHSGASGQCLGEGQDRSHLEKFHPVMIFFPHSRARKALLTLRDQAIFLGFHIPLFLISNHWQHFQKIMALHPIPQKEGSVVKSVCNRPYTCPPLEKAMMIITSFQSLSSPATKNPV